MMIIEKKLYSTKEKFFGVLIEAIILDVKNSNGKTITEKDIKKGYSYTKGIRNKKNHPAKAVIATYDKPNRYCLKITSDSGTTTIDYQIKALDDEEITVVYKEEYQNKKGKVANGFFYQRSLKKRMNMYFKQLQKYLNSK